MCDPSTAAKVAKAQKDQTAVPTTKVDTITGAPRQFALKTGVAVPSLPVVAGDITKQRQVVL